MIGLRLRSDRANDSRRRSGPERDRDTTSDDPTRRDATRLMRLRERFSKSLGAKEYHLARCPNPQMKGSDLESLFKALEETKGGGGGRDKPHSSAIVLAPTTASGGSIVIVSQEREGRKRKRDSSETESLAGSVVSEYSLFVRNSVESDCDGGGDDEEDDLFYTSDLVVSDAKGDVSQASAPFYDLSNDARDFTVLQSIGEGTFATVHLCDYPEKSICDFAAIKCSRKEEADEDLEMDRKLHDCAYKNCPPGYVTYELLVYLKLWNSGNCPGNIPCVFDYGELTDRRCYIAMQLLGKSWEAMIEDRSVGRDMIPSYLNQILDCLEKVHACGLVHCDVKPKNILAKDMVCISQPFLIDFGLAFHMRSGQNGACREFIGTFDYSSDDRLLARRDPLPIDDIISLGYTALHAWLGDLPWRCLPVWHSSSAESCPQLEEFSEERREKMRQGLDRWAPFFKEWFDYCDSVLSLKDPSDLSYDKLRSMIKKNEDNLMRSRRYYP